MQDEPGVGGDVLAPNAKLGCNGNASGAQAKSCRSAPHAASPVPAGAAALQAVCALADRTVGPWRIRVLVMQRSRANGPEPAVQGDAYVRTAGRAGPNTGRSLPGRGGNFSAERVPASRGSARRARPIWSPDAGAWHRPRPPTTRLAKPLRLARRRPPLPDRARCSDQETR